VADGEASIIVIDSHGDLIQNIATLKVFAPGEPLHGRLSLIDPTDIENCTKDALVNISRRRASKLVDPFTSEGVFEDADGASFDTSAHKIPDRQGEGIAINHKRSKQRAGFVLQPVIGNCGIEADLPEIASLPKARTTDAAIRLDRIAAETHPDATMSIDFETRHDNACTFALRPEHETAIIGDVREIDDAGFEFAGKARDFPVDVSADLKLIGVGFDAMPSVT
jgi:hypothetical protein